MKMKKELISYIANGIAVKFGEAVRTMKFQPEGEFGRRQLAKGEPTTAKSPEEWMNQRVMQYAEENDLVGAHSTDIHDHMEKSGFERPLSVEFADAGFIEGMTGDDVNTAWHERNLPGNYNDFASLTDLWTDAIGDSVQNVEDTEPTGGGGGGEVMSDEEMGAEQDRREAEEAAEEEERIGSEAEVLGRLGFEPEAEGGGGERNDATADDATIDQALEDWETGSEAAEQEAYERKGGGGGGEPATFVIDNGNYELAYNPEEGTWDSTDPDFQELSLPGDEDGPQSDAMGSEMEAGEMTSGPRAGTRNEEGQISEASQAHQAERAGGDGPTWGTVGEAEGGGGDSPSQTLKKELARLADDPDLHSYGEHIAREALESNNLNDMVNALTTIATDDTGDFNPATQEIAQRIMDDMSGSTGTRGVPLERGEAERGGPTADEEKKMDAIRQEYQRGRLSSEEAAAAMEPYIEKYGDEVNEGVLDREDANLDEQDRTNPASGRCEDGTHRNRKTGNCEPFRLTGDQQMYIANGIAMRFGRAARKILRAKK